MRNIIPTLLLIISFSFSSISQVYNQIQKIIPSDRASGDVFGFAVSVSGNFAIVGAQYEADDAQGMNTLVYAGSAYIFEKDNYGHWIQAQKIVPSDRTANDYFGGAVSISGDKAIIGAYEKNAIGGNTFSHAGAAYIFERDGNGIWNEVKKIVASDTGAADHFGYSVSISGDRAIIGSPIDAEDATGANTLNGAGSAYMFERDGNGIWNQIQKIVPSDRASADFFGASVSISTNYAIVGAYHEDEDAFGGNTQLNAGSAYIFERDGNGIWNQAQKIVSSDRAPGDRLGMSVSISGLYAVVGAYLEDEDETGGYSLSNAGSAYIFERNGNNNWLQIKKITASDRDPNDYFGQCVNINGNYVIVGAQNESADVQGGNIFASAGAAYIFKRNGNGNWNQLQKIVSSDRANSDYFGFSVAISDGYALVGAYLEDEDLIGGNPLNGAGSSYIFEACHSTASTIIQTVCSSYTSPSGVYTWANPGIYMDTIPNSTGCDSVITIQLILGGSSSSTIKTVCDSYTSASGNYSWTHTGTYLDTIPNSFGCDSIITTHLTVNNSSSTINATVCNSYTSPSGNYIWYSSNTYIDTIPNAKGCDSIITIHLTTNSSYSTINQIACNQYTSPSGNYTWTTSNIYMDTIPNSKGCDSIITIQLTINTLSSSSTLTLTACISYISPSGNYTWTNAGTYIDTIPNTASCDSIITIHLSINTISTSSTINQTVCNSYTSPSGNYAWTSTGIYNDTIPNTAGCDSTITINLVVNNSFSTINQMECYNYTSPSGNFIWTNSGIYMDTIPNSKGCDSIITINLAIMNSSSTINQTACYFYTSPSGNYTWTSSNTYKDTIPNANGCDSLITIHLLFKNSDSTLNQTACNSYTSPSGHHTWTTSNIYMDTIPNVSGCDSIITINLTVNTTSTESINQTTCNSYTSPSGNYVWTNSNIYTDTIPNTTGCDSIITINLTVNTTSTESKNQTACNSYTSPSGNHTWITSNIYQDTIVNTAGCDSLIIINLTIISIEILINQNGTTLTVSSPADSYQWLDCDNEDSIIAGEVSQDYTAQTNGNYAVILTHNGCTDTSSCYSIISAGLVNNTLENEISIFPNPAKNTINISFKPLNNENIAVKLMNNMGQIVYSQSIKNSGKDHFNLRIESGNFANGLYLMVIQNGNKQMNSKFMIDN